MSGITGIYCLDRRPIEHHHLHSMTNVLSHRGPDGTKVWMNGSIGFGHQMLWTTPESLTEKLPFVKNELAITADARIDNRDQLKAVLNLPDRSIAKISDSELILAAYEQWGEDCPNYLLGDFAFAIWDERAQKLFCVRDHFGVKPFYYYLSSRLCSFASEIKALLCLPEIPCQINEVKIGDYLISNFDDTATTFYQNILRLPPAHSLVVSPEGFRVQSYWSLDPTKTLKLGSDAEYAEAFLSLFITAVDCRLRSAFPIGSRLSGGLDSSSVTCVARNLLERQDKLPLLTFSTIYDKTTSCDEQPFINEVLAQGNLQPHYLQGDSEALFTEIDRILWHADEPFCAPGLASTWALSRLAAQLGVRVLLDGHDGDGTVSHGFGYLHELARSGAWLKLSSELKGLSKLDNEPFLDLLWSYVYPYAVFPVRRKVRSFNLQGKIRAAFGQPQESSKPPLTQRPEWQKFLNPEFVQRIELADRYHACNKRERDSAGTARQEHYRTLTRGLQPFGLEILNKAASAFSLEYRHPFWDKRLIEFCLSLPADQKLHQGWSRIVLRRAMAGILPEKIQWRHSKTNFIEYLSSNLINEHPNAQALILKDPAHLSQYIDISTVRETYDHMTTSGSNSDPLDVLAIWRTVTLKAWLDQTECRSKVHCVPETSNSVSST